MVMNKPLLGRYIKIMRTRQCIATRVLADYCHISQSYLRDLEIGTRVPENDDIYYDILKELDVRYTDDEEIRVWFDIAFNDFMTAVYNCDHVETEKIFQETLLKEEILLQSACFFDYLLLKYVYFSIHKKNDISINNIESDLNIALDLLSIEKKSIYCLYKAVRLKNNRNLEDARILFITLETSAFKNITAMANYYLGIIYYMLNNFVKSINCSMHAKKIFDSLNNYERSLYCSSNIIPIFTNMKQYHEALEMSLDCLKTANRLNIKPVAAVNAYNITLIYILMKEYHHVNKFVNLAIEFGSTNLELYFNNAYAYIKMGNLGSASHWVDLGKTLAAENNYFLMKFEYLELYIQNDRQNVKDILKKIIDYSSDITFYEDKRFFLKEMINWLEDDNQPLESLNYYKQLEETSLIK